jgi:hypothetical protein
MKILENLYEILSKSRKVGGMEIWGLDEGLNEINKIRSAFC